ncbi:MAG: Nif11 family protein [Cyanobacteria bacterium]|nr:Nif11 family protein [Cyanobacteriota bacterium]
MLSTNPRDILVAFCGALNSSGELQKRVKAAVSPQEIIDIAESMGYKISTQDLRSFSKDLVASYFPWSAKGNQFRRDFFDNQD